MYGPTQSMWCIMGRVMDYANEYSILRFDQCDKAAMLVVSRNTKLLLHVESRK